jgi:ubiquinol-cytochrome c reductase cytochrome b subunit
MSNGGAPKSVTRPLEFLDQRVGLAKLSKHLRKVFPDHWSFLLGEIALYTFIILVLSGTFLTLWYKPSMQEVIYDGSYGPLRGVSVSEAYASTVDISFDVRGGMLMRQIHHWSANVFAASLLLHMLRNFFTGGFRKPRELNWLIGTILLQLGLIEGFTGYSLPDDLLSGTGLRFVEGLLLSIPVIGTYITFYIFGGEYPGDDIISRIYPVHILLLPGLLLALIALHLALLVYHKHTQLPGPGRTNTNVVGPPLMPVYIAKSGGYFFLVFGVMVVMGAMLQVNPIWIYGPYNPNQIGAGTQPDWYLGWVEGGLRIMPNWETRVAGITISWNVFVPGFGWLALLALLLAIYPYVERWVTGDEREHHILDLARNQPTRTAFGVAAITVFGLLWIGGGNDIIARTFHLAIEDITLFIRVMIFVGPVIAFMVTKRICIGLQRRDRETLIHGTESGAVVRLPNGEFVEVHRKLSPNDAYLISSHERTTPLELPPRTDKEGRERPGWRKLRFRARVSRFWFGDDAQKPTPQEYESAHEHGRGHGEIEHEEPDRTREL